MNTVTLLNEPGSSYVFNFTGSNVSRVYNMAYNRGAANVYIDGNFVETMSDYASTTRWQAVKTWSVSEDSHTIEIRRLDGGIVDLDAFNVGLDPAGAGTYDDPNSGLAYIGNWTHSSGWSGPYNGTVSWSNNNEDAVRITFQGSSITYCFTKAYNRGKAAITIDGIEMPMIDLYSPTVQWQSCTLPYALGSGIHTFHVSVSGQKNQYASDDYIDVDYLVIAP